MIAVRFVAVELIKGIAILERLLRGLLVYLALTFQRLLLCCHNFLVRFSVYSFNPLTWAIGGIVAGLSAFIQMWTTGNWTSNWITDLIDKVAWFKEGLDAIFDAMVKVWGFDYTLWGILQSFLLQ